MTGKFQDLLRSTLVSYGILKAATSSIFYNKMIVGQKKLVEKRYRSGLVTSCCSFKYGKLLTSK